MTSCVKVAISIPSDVFIEGEALTKELRTSRSDLYARALAAYVATHAGDRVTTAIDRAMSSIERGTDDFAVDLARLKMAD